MDKNGAEQYKANSTVSRYACRILCERNPPYTARIYAAAFDTTKKIKISVSDRACSAGIVCCGSCTYAAKMYVCVRTCVRTYICTCYDCEVNVQ